VSDGNGNVRLGTIQGVGCGDVRTTTMTTSTKRLDELKRLDVPFGTVAKTSCSDRFNARSFDDGNGAVPKLWFYDDGDERGYLFEIIFTADHNRYVGKIVDEMIEVLNRWRNMEQEWARMEGEG
jgi:hypothetical protein